MTQMYESFNPIDRQSILSDIAIKLFAILIPFAQSAHRWRKYKFGS